MITEWRQRRQARAQALVFEVRAQVATMALWACVLVYIFGGLLFAAGFGMSGFYLTSLAKLFGIAMPFALLLFLALDAGAGVGLLMWVTGSGMIKQFGRRTSRLLFGLSILGNGLERVLTFRAVPPAPAPVSPGEVAALVPDDNITAALTRTVQLAKDLTRWDDPVLTAVTWMMLLISIGIGVVFPVLAYLMAHGVILVRQAANAPAREEQPVPARSRSKKASVPAPSSAPDPAPTETSAETVPVPQAEAESETTTGSTAGTGVPSVDPPNETMSSRADRWILDQWDAGQLVTGADVEKEVGATPKSGLGRLRLRKMREAHPEREPKATPVGDLVSVG